MSPLVAHHSGACECLSCERLARTQVRRDRATITWKLAGMSPSEVREVLDACEQIEARRVPILAEPVPHTAGKAAKPAMVAAPAPRGSDASTAPASTAPLPRDPSTSPRLALLAAEVADAEEARQRAAKELARRTVIARRA